MNKMIKFNNFFFFLLIFSTLSLASSNSWFTLWMWLEINSLSFIIFNINNKNLLTIESSLLYFLIQTISSLFILISMINILMNIYMFNLIIISLLIKLGCIPFHYWIIMMSESINWINLFILLTWQKINPLIMMFYYWNFKFIKFYLILSIIISSIMGLNFSSLKKIMIYSSINQINWLILMLTMINKILKFYLMLYFFLMFMICYLFKIYKIKFINNLFNLKNNLTKITLFFNILSLSGMPPLMGFLMKLIIIMKLNNNFMMFFFTMFSLIPLFFYFRLMYSIFMLKNTILNFNFINFNLINLNMNNKMFFFSMINNFLMIILFLLY